MMEFPNFLKTWVSFQGDSFFFFWYQLYSIQRYQVTLAWCQTLEQLMGGVEQRLNQLLVCSVPWYDVARWAPRGYMCSCLFVLFIYLFIYPYIIDYPWTFRLRMWCVWWNWCRQMKANVLHYVACPSTYAQMLPCCSNVPYVSTDV